MTEFFDHWFTIDLFALLGFALLGWVLWSGSHHERWRRAWLRFRQDRIGLISLGVVGLYLFVGALELLQLPLKGGGSRSLLDVIYTGSVPIEKSYSAPLAKTSLNLLKPEPLTGSHLLGTDQLGYDTLSRTLKGCRTALILGGLTSLIYIPIGAILGLCAGYFRRWVDDVIQYVYSTMMSIPEILLMASIMLILGKGILQMSVALAVTSWIGLCRLIRGETMRQSERTYVTAARALGQTHWKIITGHLLPNVMHLVVINFILGFSGIVLAETTLTYLGVGLPVGTASWGSIIDGARAELTRSPVVWWNITGAATALFGLVLALNLLGDSLRRAFDPKRA